MIRSPINQIIRIRPEESDAILLGNIGGKVTDANSRAAQIIRTYYLTNEIRSHMRKILTSIARGNAPSPNSLDCNAWLLDAGIGAGKSHFLAFLMVLLTQKEDAWLALIEKENELGAKQRLDDKIILDSIEKKSHLVATIDLTNEPTEHSLAQILVTNLKKAFERELHQPLAVEPSERLIEAFYETESVDGFRKFLAANGIDDKKEKVWRKNHSPELATWIRRYYTERLKAEPHINPSWDESMRFGCASVSDLFDGGVIFFVDELSRFMARRKQAGKDEADITTLQRIARNFREDGIQVWLIATENVATSKEVTHQIKGPGTMEPLTLSTQDFKDIVLYRCRSLPDDKKQQEAAKSKIEIYWSDLKKKLNWVNGLSLDEFVQVFPYEPTLIDLTRQVCARMAETRTGIQILHATLRHRQTGNRLITADMVFDELEGKVEQEDAKANVFEATEENRAAYHASRDIFDCIRKSSEIPDGFKPKAINAVKALVLFHFAQREEFISSEDILEILSEEWSDVATRKTALMNFTGVLDKLPTVSQGHIEKDKGGYRFSVEGQISIKPDWDAEMENLKKQPDGYNPRALLRQIFTTDEELRDKFFGGLLLDGGAKTLSPKGLIWKGFAVKGVGRLIDLTQTSKLDPPNKIDQNQDFSLSVAIQDDAAKTTMLLNNCNDERIILWSPKPFSVEANGGSMSFTTLKEAYCEKPSGLSPRLLSLYLLAMARKAEVVLEAKGGTMVSKNTIEGGMTFGSGSKGVIDEIETVHRSKAPEPWDKILDVANVLLHPRQASPQRTDENYAQLAREMQQVVADECKQFAGWKTGLETFAAKVGAQTQLPDRLELLRPVLALTDLDKNPSSGLETLWSTVKDRWGDDPKNFAAGFADYRKAKEFLTQRKDDIILFARQVGAEVPEEADKQWTRVQEAKSACERAFDFDGLLCDSKKWEVYDKAQHALREAYGMVYTEAHAAYYQASETCANDLTELHASPELACLMRLESVSEIGGSAGSKAAQALAVACAGTVLCNRVLNTQLKTAVRCACGIALKDKFVGGAAEECLGIIEVGLQQALAVLQSPDIKDHLLAAPGAKQQVGLTDLLSLQSNELKRLVELATPELVEWIRQALGTLRSVEISLDGISVPPSFSYAEADAVIEAVKGHIHKLIEEAIDRAGFRKDAAAGKSVVVRIKRNS